MIASVSAPKRSKNCSLDGYCWFIIVSFRAHDGSLRTHSELSEFLKRNNGSSQCKKRWRPGCAVPHWGRGTTQIDSLRTWQHRQPSSSHRFPADRLRNQHCAALDLAVVQVLERLVRLTQAIFPGCQMNQSAI